MQPSGFVAAWFCWLVPCSHAQVVQPSLVKPAHESAKDAKMIIMGKLRLTQYWLGEVKVLVGTMTTQGNVAQRSVMVANDLSKLSLRV
jgi:hypothetical protein